MNKTENSDLEFEKPQREVNRGINFSRKLLGEGTSIAEHPAILFATLGISVLSLFFAGWSLIVSNKSFENQLEDSRAARELRTSLEIPVLKETLKEIEASKVERKSAAEVQAWQILSNNTSGNSGKIKALTYLHMSGELLEGLNLSCESMGGTKTKPLELWGEYQKCEPMTYLAGLNLPLVTYGNAPEYSMIRPVQTPEGQMRGAVLKNANFSGVNINNANLSYAQLDNSIFDGSFISKVTFRNISGMGMKMNYSEIHNSDFKNSSIAHIQLKWSHISGSDFSGTTMYRARLQNSEARGVNFEDAHLLQASLGGADIFNSNFSGVNLTGAMGLTREQIESTWAWADKWNPDTLPEYLSVGKKSEWPSPLLCDPSLRSHYLKTVSNNLESQIRFAPPNKCSAGKGASEP